MAVEAPGKAKYVRFTVDVWYQEDDHSIHMTSPDFNLHTTVNNQPGSKRCHENLYKKLQEVLQANNRWPSQD